MELTDKVIFLDTETTGLDPERNEVWEVAAGWWSHADGWHEHVWQFCVDLDRADLIALNIGRWNERFDYKSHNGRGDFCAWFQKFAWGKHICGAVPSFDAAFLGKMMRAYSCIPSWHYHLIDIEALVVGTLQARGRPVSLPWNSNEISLAVGVDPGDFERHSALGDVLWTKAMWEAI